MSDEQVADLKQFFVATTAQQTADLRSDVTGMHVDIARLQSDMTELWADVKRIDEKVDALTEFVVDALDSNIDANKARFIRFVERVGSLEQKLA